MGETPVPTGTAPFAFVAGNPEGACIERCAGTYLHGALEHPGVVEEWLGYRPQPVPSKERSYDQLAGWFEASADVDLFERAFLNA
jgi:adenosylcobyric acid synthase